MTPGEVIQVSISKGGVPKLPVAEAEAGPLGLRGDVQRNTQVHGGPLQALLLISAENIETMQREGWPVFHGALGENLTVRGIDFRRIRSGQRFRVGEAIIEITKRRAPCQTLNVYGTGIQRAYYDAQCRDHDPASPKWGMTGFYASVIHSGTIRTGDAVTLLSEAA